MIHDRYWGWVVVGSLLLIGCSQSTTTEYSNSNDGLQSMGTGGSAGENKFLKYLFNKYGSKGVISFEGLEHLMHSLGLGGLDFIPTHTLDEHRPEGFKTEDLVEPFSNPVSSNEPKVTVSFSDHQDGEVGVGRKRQTYATVANTQAPQTTEVTPNNIERSEFHSLHVPKHDAIIRSSDQIRTLNEVRAVEDNPASEPRDKISRLNSGDDVDNASSKWHNEVWQEIIFKEIHDPHHRHPRRDDRRKSCLSPMSIVHLILEEPTNTAEILSANFNYEMGSSNRHRRSLPHNHDHNHDSDEQEHEVEEILAARIKITPSTFKDLCPALLAQIDQRACQQKYQLENQPLVEKKIFSSSWLYATVCVTIISVCGLTGVAMVPLAKSMAYDEILRFLVALAVGTLCGDALMHLLPHALVSHTDQGNETLETTPGNHEHSDEPVWLCFCAFLSALLMYILETLLPLLRSDGNGGHHHGHSHAKVAPVASHEPHQSRRNTNITEDIEMDLQDSKRKELNTMLEKEKSNRKPLSPVAFMVILGDGLHNITDGLAIGAAFAADPVTGMATSFAILCHELPHELGDFALLLQTGVSIRRAMALNIVSSILSFAGMLIGLLVTGLHASVVRWIYAGTAGTFLYIALADLVPEMNRIDAIDGASQAKQVTRRLRIVCSQICGIFLGGMIMLAIALNEDHLRLLFE
ncbi:zinc transporter ZIP10 [Sabethes cyaneus]|uniref:zinc transporter ZIP10 n=1 Tax=Sabethes cyaneus TaxID=53552 RepID=UPI00237E7050|nr:zinc transporter ZIP10 [Sabethes cyaneus]